MKKVVWMFAGQGAQYYQMGRELYEGQPVFRAFMEQGDRLAQQLINESLLEIVYRPRADRFEPFRRLLYTHPAILLFECAIAEMLRRRGLRPDYLLGYSLGEYASMVVSSVLTFEEAFVAVIKQAELMEYCLPPGGMLVVLESPDVIERYPLAFRDCAVAGHNFSRNFVVSGPRAAIKELQQFLAKTGISAIELPVDWPFHSPLIEAVSAPYYEVLGQLHFASPQIPVVTATKSEFLDPPSAAHLWEVTRTLVRFADTIRWLESCGPCLYVDLGPSGSMATAVKYNLNSNSPSEFVAIATPFGHESKNLVTLLEKCATNQTSIHQKARLEWM
jgi:bacillaene synthase trans-acting acyltransferase